MSINGVNHNPYLYDSAKVAPNSASNSSPCASKPSLAGDEFVSSNATKASVPAKEMKAQLEKTKKKQGFIGKIWDGFKNLTGLGAGSNKVQKAIEKLEKGEISEEEAQKSLEKYQIGQKQCVDFVADMATGIIAVAGVAAAPFTAGASLAVTIPAAMAIGAVAKPAIKGLDALSGGREYSLKEGLKDAAMGAVNGGLGILTAGVGKAMTSGAKNIVMSATKECALSTGKKVAIRVGAAAIGGSTSGAVYGGISSGTGYLIEGGSFDEGLIDAVKTGAIGGAVFGGLTGAAMEGAVVAKEAATKIGMFNKGLAVRPGGPNVQNSEFDRLKNTIKSDPKLKDLAVKIEGQEITKDVLKEIKRTVAKTYHPDLNGGSESIISQYNNLIDDVDKLLKPRVVQSTPTEVSTEPIKSNPIKNDTLAMNDKPVSTYRPVAADESLMLYIKNETIATVAEPIKGHTIDELKTVLGISGNKFKPMRPAIEKMEVGATRKYADFDIKKLDTNAYEVIKKEIAPKTVPPARIYSSNEMIDAIKNDCPNRDLASTIDRLHLAGEIDNTQLGLIHKNVLLADDIDPGVSNALEKYKTIKYKIMNGLMRGDNVDKLIFEAYGENADIESIKTSYLAANKRMVRFLNEQNWKDELTVYRTDEYHTFHATILNSSEYQGRSLSDALQDLFESKDLSKIEAFSKAISGTEFKNASFLSTGLNRVAAESCNRAERPIMINFKTQGEAKCIFIDALTTKWSEELEVLFQAGTKYRINKIELIDNRWVIDATILGN